MELVDLYDENRVPLGKTAERYGKKGPGEYRMVVHVCVFDRQGRMLIQKRQPFKKGWSGLWDITVGGSATAGEDSQTAIMRELWEELGISIDLQNIRPHLSVQFDQGFDDMYLIKKDVDLSALTLEYEEVEEVKWATLDEILSMMDAGAFIPYQKHLLCLFFDMKESYGALLN